MKKLHEDLAEKIFHDLVTLNGILENFDSGIDELNMAVVAARCILLMILDNGDLRVEETAMDQLMGRKSAAVFGELGRVRHFDMLTCEEEVRY